MGKQKQNDTQDTQPRRGFLKNAVTATGITAVAVATGSTTASAIEAEASSEPLGKGYRETDHVRDYYKTAGM